jgi:hypothetical protein
MIQAHSSFATARIVDTMIELARCAKAHRIIVAGSKSRDLMVELHRRGYTRVATTATCGLAQGPCPVALLDWRAGAIGTLEKTLGWLAGVLAPAAVMVIWIDSADPTGSRKLASMVERVGFCIEVGTRCEDGFAIAARRQDAPEMSVAA